MNGLAHLTGQTKITIKEQKMNNNPYLENTTVEVDLNSLRILLSHYELKYRMHLQDGMYHTKKHLYRVKFTTDINEEEKMIFFNELEDDIEQKIRESFTQEELKKIDKPTFLSKFF